MVKSFAFGLAATDLTATALSVSHAATHGHGDGFSITLAVLGATSLLLSLWGAGTVIRSVVNALVDSQLPECLAVEQQPPAQPVGEPFTELEA